MPDLHGSVIHTTDHFSRIPGDAFTYVRRSIPGRLLRLWITSDWPIYAIANQFLSSLSGFDMSAQNYGEAANPVNDYADQVTSGLWAHAIEYALQVVEMPVNLD